MPFLYGNSLPLKALNLQSLRQIKQQRNKEKLLNQTDHFAAPHQTTGQSKTENTRVRSFFVSEGGGRGQKELRMSLKPFYFNVQLQHK